MTPSLADKIRRSRERYRLIAFSGVAAIFSRVVSAIVGLASVPMVVHHVGKEQFGLWMLVSSLVVWMQLADFGIANGLTNALTEAHGRDDSKAASGYMSSAFAMTFLIALGCMPIIAILYIAAPWGSILNISDPALVVLASDALLVVGLAFVINIPLSLAGRAYIAYQRSFVPMNFQASASVFSFISMWYVIERGGGLLLLVAISAFVPVLANLLLCCFLPKLDPYLRLNLRNVSRKAISRVANSSLPLFFFQCGALLVNQLVNILIAHIENLALVADYNVILRIYLFVFSIAAALTSPFYAAIRESFERRDIPWIAKAIQRSVAIRLLSLLPFVLVMVPFGDLIVQRWMGATMAVNIGIYGWSCVATLLVFSSVSSLLSETLSSLDDIWAQIGVVFLSATIVLSLIWFLVPILGVVGVFVAMTASTVFPIIWSSKRLNRKFYSNESN
ncbi:MAG: MATE family efflux transporter [Burkholderiales bacterium]|nr:MATE family efflux transporter [Burkholderiales bacterium]